MTQTSALSVEKEDFLEMDAEYRELVVHLLRLHAEGELTGSDMYALSFFPLAPDARERYICCKLAAEEVEHYMKTAALLKNLGLDVSNMVHQQIGARDYFPLEAVRFEFKTWEDRAAFSALAEYNGHYQIQNMSSSSYRPLARICPEILQEEAGHAYHGWRILTQFSKTPKERSKAQKAVERWFPIALDSFGKSDSTRSERYVAWGIKKKGNEELRQEFLADVTPRLKALGFEPPDPMANRKFV